MAYVQVRPIIKEGSNTGLEKYGLSRSPGSAFFIEALVDPRTGGRKTGLTEEEVKDLSKKLNEDLSPFSPYWDSYRIEMKDKILTLDTESPIDYVKLSVLKSSKYVAPSRTAYSTGQAPEALFIIYDSHEEVRTEKTGLERMLKANSELAKMLPTKRKWIATSIFNKSYENMDVDSPLVDLGRFIQDKPTKSIPEFLKWIDKSEVRLEGEYLIKLGVIYHALRKSGDRYMRGDVEIGRDIESAIDYITSPSRQDNRMQIENEIAAKVGMTFRTLEEMNIGEEKVKETKKAKESKS